jgi:hypothetical protein
MALVKQDVDYTIKPEATAAAPDTSDWPLLLKNYSKCKNTAIGLHDASICN